MEAWRRAEAQAWEKVEDRRWLGFWRLQTRARKEWAKLHKRQEDTRQRLDQESRTVLGRLRIWRTERSLRELVGAVRGREDLVEDWREDLDRYQKGERAALGKAHADSARQIERKVREAYRRGYGTRSGANRRPTSSARRGSCKEHGRSITRIPPRPPRLRGPERGGEGSSDDPRCRHHNVTPVLERQRFGDGGHGATPLACPSARSVLLARTVTQTARPAFTTRRCC